MQPSAGPDLPHTRSHAMHWLATAAALAAVFASASLFQPPDASAGPSTARSPKGPDPTAAAYPLDCGPWQPEVVQHAAADFDADGQGETVAVVRCRSGAGSAPSGVFVLAPARGAQRPQVVETLVDPAQRMSVDHFSVRGHVVSARLLGYSSLEVPRCCPDRERKVKWDWQGDRFVLNAAPPPGTV